MILKLLEKVCLALERQNISYMLSGSVALGFYTVARTTRDIDIVIHLLPQDVDNFLSEFEGFYYYKEGIIEEINRQGMFNLIDTTTGYKIDFIIPKRTEYGMMAFNRRKKINELGFNIWVISLEDLILNKLIWIQDYQSDRQINDIRSLFRNPEINWNYIKEWIKVLNLKTFKLLK